MMMKQFPRLALPDTHRVYKLSNKAVNDSPTVIPDAPPIVKPSPVVDPTPNRDPHESPVTKPCPGVCPTHAPPEDKTKRKLVCSLHQVA